MFTTLPDSAGDLVCLKASGRLTDEDYKDMMPRLEAVISKHGSLRLYADLIDFDGWEWRAGWDDLAFGIKHWNDIKRIALIGDANWEQLAAKIADKLSPAEVRYFSDDESESALDWVKSD